MALPLSGQADVILAAQKDAYYLEHLFQLLQDTAEHLLGPHRVVNLRAELKLASSLLYSGLTHARKGEQSPGEEYCDVVHVQLHAPGRDHMRLPPFRLRLALLLLCSLAPYVKERTEAGGWESFFAAFKPQLTARQRAELFRRRLAEQQRQREAGRVAASEEGIWKKWLPSLKKSLVVLGILQRAHLGWFYMHGEFYSWPYRLVGIRFANTKEAETKRPSYYPLGAFVFVGLAAELLPKVYAGMITLLQTWGVIWKKQKEGGAEEQSIAGKEVVASNAEQKRIPGLEGFKCGICLAEPIDDPAVPKCGHAFCYDCILALTQTKPECPVCRQEALPKDIQCIYFEL